MRAELGSKGRKVPGQHVVDALDDVGFGIDAIQARATSRGKATLSRDQLRRLTFARARLPSLRAMGRSQRRFPVTHH